MTVEIKRNLALIIILTFILTPFIMGQSAEQPSTPNTRDDNIIIDEDVIDAEIIIRVPEASIQPRTRTEEIDFTLNYLRQLIVESNKQLY